MAQRSLAEYHGRWGAEHGNSLFFKCSIVGIKKDARLQAVMSRMVVFIMRGKDVTGFSREDLVICFSCAKLGVMDSALRCQRDRPN